VSESPEAARQWAQARFHDYLLHRLSEDEEERVIGALVQIPGLAQGLTDAEERLIQSWIAQQLPAEDREAFQRYYVEGSEANRSKVSVYRALHAGRADRRLRPSAQAPIPFPSRVPARWIAGAAAASLLAGCLAVFLYMEARENSRLRSDLARLSRQPPTGPSGPRGSSGGQQPPEQPAGLNPQGGLTLDPSDSGRRLAIAAIPDRLIWSPVPDYRAQYRIRVTSSATGLEQTSALLTPQDNAIDYQPERSGAMPLPWEVSILRPAGANHTVVARYTLVKP
jgi:hypothetical protein